MAEPTPPQQPIHRRGTALTRQEFRRENAATVRGFYLQRHAHFLHRVASLDVTIRLFCLATILTMVAVPQIPTKLLAFTAIATMFVFLVANAERFFTIQRLENLEDAISRLVGGLWEDYLIILRNEDPQLIAMKARRPKDVRRLPKREKGEGSPTTQDRPLQAEATTRRRLPNYARLLANLWLSPNGLVWFLLAEAAIGMRYSIQTISWLLV